MNHRDNIIPRERLEARRRERQDRLDKKWPPESPLLGEDVEADVLPLKLKERRR